MRFVNSVIREFSTNQTNGDNELTIQSWLFKDQKKIVLAEIRYCLENQSSSKQFIKKFEEIILAFRS